jgi:hypothetical protein
MHVLAINSRTGVLSMTTKRRRAIPGARKTYDLHVTQEIINSAIPRDSGHCVFADALKEAVPEATRVNVDLQTIRWSDQSTGYRYACFTPAVAQAMLVNWDQGKREAVHPVTIRIKPVQVVPIRGRDKPMSDERRARKQQSDRAYRKRIYDERQMEHEGGDPLIEGGQLPPVAALSNTRGRRRAYGLSTLKP